MVTEQLEMVKEEKTVFTPTIIGFYCRWCTHAAADLAGTSRIHVPADVIGIRVPCSGRVDPSFVYQAFLKGADGVLIGGCHPGDCAYKTGNLGAERRVRFAKKLVGQLGMNEGRVRMVMVSAAEGDKFAAYINEFADEIRAIGPNPIRL